MNEDNIVQNENKSRYGGMQIVECTFNIEKTENNIDLYIMETNNIELCS